MLPFLEKGAFRIRGRRKISEEDAEVTSLGAGPPGGKQLKPIVAQDAQTQLDECSGPGVAGMPNLRSSDPLWGGKGVVPRP